MVKENLDSVKKRSITKKEKNSPHEKSQDVTKDQHNGNKVRLAVRNKIREALYQLKSSTSEKEKDKMVKTIEHGFIHLTRKYM